MEKDFSKIENENNSFISFLNRIGVKQPEPKEKSLWEEQSPPLTFLFFIELVHHIRKILSSIKIFAKFSREKFRDVEFGKYFYRTMSDDIDKIDSMLEVFLNYVRVNTAIKKTNTVHSIIEEGLKNHITQIEDKEIKIIKKFEKDLPETIVHDEQLRFIFNSILDYAIASVHPNGAIGFLTKSFDIKKGTRATNTWSQEDGRYIEILIVFTGYKKQEEGIELILRLIEELTEKNQGTMKFELNEKKSKTLIFFRFPIERRKVVYYQSISA